MFAFLAGALAGFGAMAIAAHGAVAGMDATDHPIGCLIYIVGPSAQLAVVST